MIMPDNFATLNYMDTTKVKLVLLILCVIGIFVPYYFLVSHIAVQGMHLEQIYQEIAASRMALFGWVDVIISAIVLLLATFSVKGVSHKRTALVVLLTVGVGVSAGLPLFLYFLVDSGSVKLRRQL